MQSSRFALLEVKKKPILMIFTTSVHNYYTAHTLISETTTFTCSLYRLSLWLRLEDFTLHVSVFLPKPYNCTRPHLGVGWFSPVSEIDGFVFLVVINSRATSGTYSQMKVIFLLLFFVDIDLPLDPVFRQVQFSFSHSLTHACTHPYTKSEPASEDMAISLSCQYWSCLLLLFF